jgi:hypothetical protein
MRRGSQPRVHDHRRDREYDHRVHDRRRPRARPPRAPRPPSGDPMARREVTRIAAPPGAKLEVIGS